MKADVFKKRKHIFIAIAVVLCLLGLLAYLITSSKRDDRPLVLAKSDGYTEYDGVDICIKELVMDESNSYIVLEWDNQTGESLGYGEEFYVFRKNGIFKQNCQKENNGWLLPLYVVDGENPTREINLWNQNLTKKGDYVLEFEFMVGESKTQYKAYIEFTLEKDE